MESILTNLHLDLTAFVWHSVNFLVLTGALWWLFFRPLARLIEDRKARIHESLARAEEIDRQAAGAEAERQELVAGAHREATEIRRRAHEQVQRYVTRSRAGASADADRIRERAAARHGLAATQTNAEGAGPVERRPRRPRVINDHTLARRSTLEPGSVPLPNGAQFVGLSGLLAPAAKEEALDAAARTSFVITSPESAA
jgi:F0F1-type ATP synthase membrane subunit b/b'